MAFDKELLDRKIKEAGITQVALAKLVSVDARTVSRWLHGDKPPKRSHIEELAKHLRCRPEDFDPRYADGENEIYVSGRVSAASHNAFATMKLVYGVDEQTIIELAPMLFSIVAARAVNLPEQDSVRWSEIQSAANSLGISGLSRFENPSKVRGSELDEQAARGNACFGFKVADDEWEAEPRNLFVEVMGRLIHEAGSIVSMDQFVRPSAGEAPTALGFNPHAALFDFIAEGDSEIVRKLARGEVRLSQSMIKAELNADGSLEAQAEIIRKDLAEQAASHRAKLLDLRQQGLAKLAAWRTSYQDQYPDLAKEYDDLVAAYCHEENWYPEYYRHDDKEAAYADPFAEIRFVDDGKLRSQRDGSGRGELWLTFNAPEPRRLKELEKHRRLSKAEFVEKGR